MYKSSGYEASTKTDRKYYQKSHDYFSSSSNTLVGGYLC